MWATLCFLCCKYVMCRFITSTTCVCFDQFPLLTGLSQCVPLLNRRPHPQDFPHWRIYGLDCSARAIDFVKANDLFDPVRCGAFVVDLVNDDLPACLHPRAIAEEMERAAAASAASAEEQALARAHAQEAEAAVALGSPEQAASSEQAAQALAAAEPVPPPSGGIDFMTLVFVLSALHPTKIASALLKLRRSMNPGGHVFVRDYGKYDHAMLRFKPGSRLGEDLYVRQDGTRTYFFSKERMEELLTEAGFEVVECVYVMTEIRNRKDGLNMKRGWLQARARVKA